MLGVGQAQTASREVADIIPYADHPEVLQQQHQQQRRQKGSLRIFQTLFAACFTEIGIPSLSGKSSWKWKAPLADAGKMFAWQTATQIELPWNKKFAQPSARAPLFVMMNSPMAQCRCFRSITQRVHCVFALQRRDCHMWLPLACISNRQVKTVTGGVSGFLFHILQQVHREPLPFCLGPPVVRQQLVLKQISGTKHH